jgi:hypothetical protein
MAVLDRRVGGFCMRNSGMLLLTVLISVGFTQPAYAYLDAGTGSMLLQLLLGGFAGFLVIGKLYWAKIKGIFS